MKSLRTNVQKVIIHECLSNQQTEKIDNWSDIGDNLMLLNFITPNFSNLLLLPMLYCFSSRIDWCKWAEYNFLFILRFILTLLSVDIHLWPYSVSVRNSEVPWRFKKISKTYDMMQLTSKHWYHWWQNDIG